MPPLSSKKRSAITVFCVGTAPSTERPATTYSTACSAPASSSPHSLLSQFTAAETSADCRGVSPGTAAEASELILSRNSARYAESSGVRPGAPPRQNGVKSIVGNRAATGDGRQPATSAPADASIHAVSVQVGSVTSPAAGDALGEHFNDSVEIGAH